MAITLADIKVKKSFAVSDTAATNGNRLGTAEILPGARHALIPRVTPAERAAGITRYRKAFLHNVNAAEEQAYSTMVYLEFPSPGGDRVAIAAASAKADVQTAIAGGGISWMGVGALAQNVSAGAVSVQLTMESNDYAFPASGTLHISNKYKTGQTIGAGVRPGDSVQISAGTWGKISATNDTAYPKGLYVGGNVVLTIEETTKEEWVTIHPTTAVSWSGNTATVTLAEGLANAYTAANTYAAAAVVLGDLATSVANIVKTSAAGTYDNVNYPLATFNASTVDDTITLTFTSATAFVASGAILGNLGSGTVAAGISPVNGDNEPYFTLPAGFFGGTWATNDTLVFDTVSAAAPVWFRQIVPAATAAEANNLIGWGWYAE